MFMGEECTGISLFEVTYKDTTITCGNYSDNTYTIGIAASSIEKAIEVIRKCLLDAEIISIAVVEKYNHNVLICEDDVKGYEKENIV